MTNTVDTKILIAALDDPDRSMRHEAAIALGIDTLVGALEGASAGVRAHAADTLGHLGSPLADAAAGVLASLVGDVDAAVRFAAVSALGELATACSAAVLTRAEASADPVASRVARHLLGRPAAS